jgi:cytosine/adenosine deaminase-related metal-dependent hydrolase
VSANPGRDGGEGAELTPAVSAHHGLCMAVHVHSTRDERLACEMEHDAAMARLLLAGEVA